MEQGGLMEQNARSAPEGDADGDGDCYVVSRGMWVISVPSAGSLQLPQQDKVSSFVGRRTETHNLQPSPRSIIPNSQELELAQLMKG